MEQFLNILGISLSAAISAAIITALVHWFIFYSVIKSAVKNAILEAYELIQKTNPPKTPEQDFEEEFTGWTN